MKHFSFSWGSRREWAWCAFVFTLVAWVHLAQAGDEPDPVEAIEAQLCDRVLFPQAHMERDEPPAEYEARLELVAKAVASVPKRWRPVVLGVGYGESRWAKYVQFNCNWIPEGTTGHCDHGSARGFWQHHEVSCPELWLVPAGSEQAILLGAQCTYRRLREAYAKCGTLEGAIARYGGAKCDFRRKSITVKAELARKLGWED